jgi:REP element-mobilizing transposase RayT
MYTLLMPADIGRVRDSGPIAYFLTWTTHGSWLPGDPRGWVKRGGDFRPADQILHTAVVRTMTNPPLALSPAQRGYVRHAIVMTCRQRGWVIHACQCRIQHVHVVVTATHTQPELVLRQLKVWSTRALATTGLSHRRCWSRGGSARLIFDEYGLQRVVEYVVDGQDRPRS